MTRMPAITSKIMIDFLTSLGFDQVRRRVAINSSNILMDGQQQSPIIKEKT